MLSLEREGCSATLKKHARLLTDCMEDGEMRSISHHRGRIRQLEGRNPVNYSHDRRVECAIPSSRCAGQRLSSARPDPGVWDGPTPSSLSASEGDLSA
jgi:hypothetical protein